MSSVVVGADLQDRQLQETERECRERLQEGYVLSLFSSRHQKLKKKKKTSSKQLLDDDDDGRCQTVEKQKEATSSNFKPKAKKKLDRYEELLKTQTSELSMIKVKSGFAVMITTVTLISVLNSWFEGRPVARLPFEPISFVQSLSHRSLPGTDYYECSMTFFFVLCSMFIRGTVQKILGTEPPKSASGMPGMFDTPK